LNFKGDVFQRRYHAGTAGENATDALDDDQRWHSATRGDASALALDELIRENFHNATFLRPFYVLGPGHYWPLILSPLFKILEWIPSTSQKAKALRLVTLKQILRTLLYAVENQPEAGMNIIEIEEIRKM
jgi:hypothetical protein